jgi:hypothetical protein
MGATVKFLFNGEVEATVEAESDGAYSVVLREGTFTLNVSKRGYFDGMLQNIVVNAGTLELQTITLMKKAVPTVTTVSPGFGSVDGGTIVTINGTNFEPGAAVSIGGAQCSGVSIQSSTQLTCTSGANSSTGVLPVTVTNLNGEVGTLQSGFRYHDLRFTVTQRTLSACETFQFPISGGVPPYTYSVDAGPGSVSSNGTFTPEYVEGSSTIKVTDSQGNTATATAITANWDNSDSYQLASGKTAYPTSIVTTGSTLLVSGIALDANNYSYWTVRRSDDSGSTWATKDSYRYSSSPSNRGSNNPVSLLVAQNGYIYAAGYGEADSGQNVWIVRRSTDGGDNWTISDIVTNTGGNERGASARGITVGPNGTIFVIGSAYRTDGSANLRWRWVVRRSVDNGDSWSTVDEFTDATYSYRAVPEVVLANSGKIFVSGTVTKLDANAYPPLTSKLLTRTSDDNGATWSTSESYIQGTETFTSSQGGYIMASDKTVVVGHGTGLSSPNATVFGRVFDSVLSSWSELFSFVSSTGIFFYGAGLSNGNVYLVGLKNPGYWHVRRSANNGATWAVIDSYKPNSSQGSYATSIAFLNNQRPVVAGPATFPSEVNYRWLVRISKCD